MKPIIVNIKDMSDSREVYDSRPSKIISVFVYISLSLLLIAILWMCLGRIDIVVKSSGVIRPNEDVSTVSNMYGGKLEKVEVEDGQVVTKGQLLYSIEHKELLSNQSYYQEQIEYYDKQLGQLQIYLKSVQEKKNYFTASPEDTEYLTKYKSYEIQLDSLEAQNQLSYKDSTDQIEYLTAQIAYSESQISGNKQLLSSIQNGKNLCSKDESLNFYHQFELYEKDYASLKKQYEDEATQIKLSTKSEGLNNSLDYYTKMRAGLKLLISSVKWGKDKFEEDSNYRMQFNAYMDKRKELSQNYESASKTYEVNCELKGLAVTDWEVEESKIARDTAKKAYESYKSDTLIDLNNKLDELDQKIKDTKLSKKSTLSQEELLSDNEKSKKTALEQFQLKYEVDLDNKLTTLQESLSLLKFKLLVEQRNKDSIVVYENEGQSNQYAAVLKLQNDEINTTVQTIESYENKKKDLESSLEGIEQQIDDCNVTAPCNGKINLLNELVKGDFLAAGSQVLMILPEDDNEYKAMIYISNSDIGKIKEGMEVKLDVQAYPNSEYGYLYGKISKVSNDIKVNNQNGMGYYVAEVKLNANGFYDKDGSKLTFKAGMSCEAKIITGEQSIMTYILDELKLLVTD